MEKIDKTPEIQTFYPKTKNDWRNWLQEHHQSKTGIWVILYKKNSGKPTISWSESVDEALCFGWIDSIKKSLDEERSIQFFSKRKPKSTWSKINKEKIKVLTENNLITKAGLESIEIAQQNGSWTILDEVENLTIPKDLEWALKNNSGAEEYFYNLSKSNKKAMLQWLVLAKRPETREKRITEIAFLASQKQKPKQF